MMTENAYFVVIDLNKRLKVEETKQECAKLIGYNTCFVCGCIKSKKGMTVHHLWYVFNDVTYDKYKPQNDTNKLKYYTDLLEKVREEPTRFMFLCNTHHQALERLNRFKPSTIVKLLEALLFTKTNKKYAELSPMLKVMVESFNPPKQ